MEREDITKEGTRRCPLPSPDQCAINDAADKVFGDAPYDGVCRQSRGLIFPDCLPENWLFKTHLTPSYRFALNTRCYSCVLLRGTKFEGNRSSPLYAICLNWITFLQFVDFDSKLFYGRHCQIEPDGEHPTSIERNSLFTSLCARRTRTLCIHTLQFIVPMPSAINSTNFSSLVSTALFPESNRTRWHIFAR